MHTNLKVVYYPILFLIQIHQSVFLINSNKIDIVRNMTLLNFPFHAMKNLQLTSDHIYDIALY